MQAKITTRTTCRICGSGLKDIFSLGELYLSNFLAAPDSVNEPKAPLTVALCQNCELLQLRHTIPQDLMYRNYWYKSSVNDAIVKDLKEIVVSVLKQKMDQGNWIDIGANDGTLLSFVPNGFTRIGIEPAENLRQELSQNCDEVFCGLWENYASKDKAEVITAIGMLYDSEDPNAFIANVKKHLAEDGIFIAQMMTLKQMIENNDVSNICHEHLEYYSYNSLVKLFEQNGLEIFEVEENGINGGSYRLFARHYKEGSVEHREPDVVYDDFIKNIEKNKKHTVDFIKQEVGKGKKVYGYGASTKMGTILQFYGITDKMLQGIADKNSIKWGKYTINPHIPIISETEAREKADYFWIFPWGFTHYFLEREKQWLKKGGKFIVCTPKFKILDYADFKKMHSMQERI